MDNLSFSRNPIVESDISKENFINKLSAYIHDMKENVEKYAEDPNHNPAMLARKRMGAARLNSICNRFMDHEFALNQLTSAVRSGDKKLIDEALLRVDNLQEDIVEKMLTTVHTNACTEITSSIIRCLGFH